MNDKLTLDAAPSRRHRDENGFLHVDACHITREQVAPYYGREIPGWEALGLDPEKLYHAWRPADELEKAAATVNGLPILWGHSPESADAPQLDRRIGSMGTDASFKAPYLDNSLIFTVADAIEAIEDGRERELSLSYRYEPDFTPGSFNGEPYDFVMRNLRGNHLALVPEGRAGASCCVADAVPDGKEGDGWITTEGGKHIHFKDGEIDKGNIGQEVSITGEELGAWKDVKELRQKAVDYYKANLQGKPAHRDDVGEIRFSRKGRDEMEAYSADPDKLLMVPALRTIIETGELGTEEKCKHPRKDGIVAFVPVTKKVNFKGEEREVEVLLGKDQRGNLYYDLFLDGARQGGKKKSPASYPEQIQGSPGKNPPTSGVGTNLRLAGDSVPGSNPEPKSGPAEDSAGKPAVEVNIRILPATVNDGQVATHKTRKGGFMGKLKTLFGGASDEAPENTETPAPEDHTAPEGENKPEDKGMDDGMKAAMDKCGLDAEDPAAQAAFAEGVKYGEALMREKGEREKLDSEHEAEGMEKAMDSCGLDAENPQESRAFAEGVKYGEKLERNPEERKKLDAEHEAEGMKKAMGKDEDKAAAIRRVLDEVPGLTPEQRAKLESSLTDLAYDPATGDEDLTAQDAALRRSGRSRSRGPRPLMASDAALIQARAVAQAQDNMRAITRAVRPLVGELDALDFDSAANVYGYALTQSGVDALAYSRSAWRGMVEMLLREKRGLSVARPLAQDRAPAKFDGPFAGLSRINIG